MNKTRHPYKNPDSWENATLANNFLFCKIMSSEPELCRELLELLLHIKIDRLERPQSERSMQDSVDSKSVRFDVYTQDGKRIFDLEMQTTKNSNLPKRARYYQSAIDTESLTSGTNFSRLKDSFVIFLCLDDIFGMGLPVYRFENICVDDSGGKNRIIKLEDKAYKIFFNASNCDKLKNSKERNFFKFLKGEEAADDFTRQLQERVARARKNRRWRRQYFMWINVIDEEKAIAREEGLAEGRAEGREVGLVEGREAGRAEGREVGLQEGRAEGRAEGTMQAHLAMAEKLLRMNLLTAEQIAEASELPLSEILSLKEKLS